ncbi:MAG TPA: beta-ketoacyl synthase chain length factor, partial [Burkholderiales bacterium]|nr:beta-ketoacyl synthase chain length factor [Burkholderiales bacterium]
AGGAAYIDTPTIVTADELLPAAERRRTGPPVKLALAAGRAALNHAQRDASTTATVFTSSAGDGENIHHICATLASPEREISPTRFHNSVHNAAAGYWSIATRSQAQSTSLCCYDASFAAGLLDAAAQVAVDGKPVALIAYDQPYLEPLHAVRAISASFGTALVLTPDATARVFARLEVDFMPGKASATRMADRGLEALRAGVPAARCLPLLCALARGTTEIITLEYIAGSHLDVQVAPC